MRLSQVYTGLGVRGAVLGVDPGLGATGLCLLYGHEMTATTVRPQELGLANRAREIANAAKNLCSQAGVVAVDLLVIELMQVYEQRKQAGDPNDLINLGLVAGWVGGRVLAHRIELPQPHTWKGGVPKDIHHKRLRAAYPWLPQRMSKDALDAFGLALYGKERLQCLYPAVTPKL